MAKAKSVIDVLCPCCQTTLKVDTATGMVLSHKQPEKPRPIEDLAVAVAALNRGVEDCVRLAPAQYQWSYKRYAIRPPGDTRKVYKSIT